MSLPFADKPEASSIYQDLKSLSLADLTADQFDELRERIFSEGVAGAEDEYRRLLLLGQASQKISSSGAIPATAKVVIIDYGASHTPDDGAYYTMFTPAKGEVWELGGFFIYSASGLSGFNLRLLDNVTTASTGTETGIIIADGSSGDVFDNGYSPISFDENMSLQMDPQGTVTGDSTAAIYIYRIR